MSDDNQITYKKLKDGTWGLRGMNLQQGQTVTVTTKAGVQKQERVGKVLVTFDDGFSLAEIKRDKRPQAVNQDFGWEDEQ